MATAARKKPELVLRDYALAFPEAAEEFPWGERVIKVRGKIFVFLGGQDGELRVSVKLPISFEMALTLPFAARFGTVDSFDKVIYMIALITSAAATALIIGPVAYHRVLFRRGRKPELVQSAQP